MAYVATDVRILTTKEGFKLIESYIKERAAKENIGCLLNEDDIDMIAEIDNFVLLVWDYINWQRIFPEVELIISSLELLKNDNIPYGYAQISKDGVMTIEIRDKDKVLPSIDYCTGSYFTPMDNKDKYYALFSCDEWKSYSSMRFLGVFTEQALRIKLAKELDDKNMEVDSSVNIYTCNPEDLNSILGFGFVQELKINVEL